MTKSIVVVGGFMSNKEHNIGDVWSDGNAYNFKKSLRSAGISPSECFFTNVFNMTPPGRYSDAAFFVGKKEGVAGLKPLRRGKFLDPQWLPQLHRLWKQIEHHNPNLVIAAGDLALWATATGVNTIDAARGRVTEGNKSISRRKVLPLYSAQQVQQNHSFGVIQHIDLQKAQRESLTPVFSRPQRWLHIEPTLEDLEDFYQKYIEPSPWLSSDIETKADMITCISFAPSPERALVVPFFSESTPDGNYWPDKKSEYLAWVFVRRMLKLGKRVAGQNYQYDMQHELVSMGIPNPDMTDDTMLLHHALQPEMKKGLGFLASCYTDEIAWKSMHKHVPSDKLAKKGEDE